MTSPKPPAIESPNENDIKFAPLVWEHVNPYGRYELDMNAWESIQAILNARIHGQLVRHGADDAAPTWMLKPR